MTQGASQTWPGIICLLLQIGKLRHSLHPVSEEAQPPQLPLISVNAAQDIRSGVGLGTGPRGPGSRQPPRDVAGESIAAAGCVSKGTPLPLLGYRGPADPARGLRLAF